MRPGYIALTEICSHRCLACPCNKTQNGRNAPLTLSEVQTAVEKAFEDGGLDSLILSGGEPTCHPEIRAILRYLAKTNIPAIGFLTTCDRFGDPQFLRDVLQIAPANRWRITTALHSFDPKKHDAFTNCFGSFEKSIRGMNAAIEAGIPVALKYIVTQPTYRDFERYVDEYFRRFPSSVSLVVCHLDYCGAAEAQKELVQVRFDESRPFLEAGLDRVVERAQMGDQRTVRVFDAPLCAFDPFYWSFLQSQAKYRLAVYSGQAFRIASPNATFPMIAGRFSHLANGAKFARIVPELGVPSKRYSAPNYSNRSFNGRFL